MVRLTAALARIPVIKFRKGGIGVPSASPSATSVGAPSAPVPASSPVGRPAAMSTSSISDIDLPVRYQRRPLSEEEINHINGGGIV